MDQAILDRAVKALAELNAKPQQESKAFGAPENLIAATTEPTSSTIGEEGWPSASLDAQRRFGQPHVKLFPVIGRKVRTPNGPGTLLQVFEDRVTVLLDSELSRCSFFRPIEIECVSWEL